jgi:membrane protease YdiL (CAAX protease family)
VAAQHFGVSKQLGDRSIAPLVLAAFSVAILLAPFWAFGWGFERWLAAALPGRFSRIVAPQALLIAYPIFAIPRHDFRWDMLLGMSAVVLASTLAVYFDQDFLPLAILGISVDLHFFDKAWPVAGLNSLPKLLFVDTGLFAYLVIRPIGGIGYDFRPRLKDFAVGLREFLYFTPLALALGFALRFLHFHPVPGTAIGFLTGWIFTIIFIAVPEELFFRGLMLNLLERRIGARRATMISSLLFGLAHFNKRAVWFNCDT